MFLRKIEIDTDQRSKMGKQRLKSKRSWIPRCAKRGLMGSMALKFQLQDKCRKSSRKNKKFYFKSTEVRNSKTSYGRTVRICDRCRYSHKRLYGKPDVANPAIWNKKKKKYRLPKLKIKLCISTKPLCFCVFNILFSNVCNLMRKGWKLVYTKFLTGANSRPEKSKAVRNTFEIFQNKHVLSQEQCEPSFRLQTSRTKQCCSNKKMSVVSFQRAR